MAKFYHLDRGNKLYEGQIVQLDKYNDIICDNNSRFTQILQNHYNDLFPNGVTEHGNGYFASNNQYILINPQIELLFEYVRKANFKGKPSRAESFFAVESINDIQRFTDRYSINIFNCTIWEVEAESYYRYNMNLLNISSSNLVTSYIANEYWSGGTAGDSNPFWEYLLVPPVKIIKKVNIEDFFKTPA